VKVSNEVITPEIAKQMLAANSGNRTVSQANVKKIVRSMLAGDFVLNGDSIRIDSDGELLDGQHRLIACVESGVSFQSIVIRGLDRSVFRTIDQGSTRRASDVLSCIKEANAKTLAATLRLIDSYEKGTIDSGRRTMQDNYKIIDLLEKYPKARDSVSVVGKKLRGLISESGASACHYLFASRDSVAADLMIEQLHTGRGMQDGSPVFLLRERLLANLTNRSKLPDVHKIALMIKAWNSLRDGKPIKQLKFCDGESFPVVK
jgi:hypothetical protein